MHISSTSSSPSVTAGIRRRPCLTRRLVAACVAFHAPCSVAFIVVPYCCAVRISRRSPASTWSSSFPCKNRTRSIGSVIANPVPTARPCRWCNVFGTVPRCTGIRMRGKSGCERCAVLFPHVPPASSENRIIRELLLSQ